MACSVINSIYSALNDLVLLHSLDPARLVKPVQLMYYLKNLKTFILCTRMLGNDVQLRFDDKVSTLGSLLQRLDDAVGRNAAKIQPYCHGWQGEFHKTDADKITRNFERDIQCFEEEICRWYLTLSEYFMRQTSSPSRIVEIMEIIDSVLESLADFVRSSYWDSIETIEAVVEKITFLRSFIRFATLPNVDPRELENLLVQIEAVSVNAAHISYMVQPCSRDVWMMKIPSNVSVLVQKIKLIDPQVYETYAQALTSSKLSRQLQSPIPHRDLDDPLSIMSDFIDFLLWNIWDMLKMDTRVISLKCAQERLYEDLRWLRASLKKQPKKFDEKIRELTRVLICDAGIIIFSLNQKHEEVVISIFDLRQRINHIREEVGGKDPEMKTFNFPRTNELGFIDSLLENLMGMASYCKAYYTAQSGFQMIHDELSLLRCSLGEIVEVHKEREELQAPWNAGIKVAYRVEFLFDQLVLGEFQGPSTPFDSSIEEIIKEIKTIKSEIYHACDKKVKKVSKTSNLVPPQSSAPVADEIVYFDDNTTSIIHQLTRGSKQLKIVAIVGMPGIGKTTLATKVYNDPSLTFHFQLRVWCCVSQQFDKKKVLLQLLNHIVPKGNFEMAEQDLAENLRRHLKRKRYLVFLDDVWHIEVWNTLRASFPDDDCGSRIILTSRICDVAPQSLLYEEPHFPRLLTSNESLELLKRKLFPGTYWPPALYELGIQIAENCKGLPLTVVIVAGLLATLDLEGWSEVLQSLISGSSCSTEQCMNTLELSYKHLPDYLKPCFLYFGLFPEDQEVSVKRLIWLWMAEGFVRKTELKSLEDVARDYMMDLVGRSLVIASKKRSRGGVKACRVHDLLHDFCKIKAKEENFFQHLKGCDELLSFNEPGYLRRLCVHSERKHFKNLRLFRPQVHSLLFFTHNVELDQGHDISFIIPRCNRLRVLDIGQFVLGSGIPSDIELFVQLKYLAVCGRIDDIPSCIGNLSNLETFILDSPRQRVSLPDSFWNLQKLRHLAIQYGFHFPIENLENCPDLYDLESCSGAIIFSGDNVERQMRKFPNIRELQCYWYWECYDEIFIPDFLSRLESLHLSSRYEDPEFEGYVVQGFRFEFDFPENVRKLTLDSFRLHQSDLSVIGKIPCLEVLKFYDVNFHENTWDMVEGEFSKLRFLELSDSEIFRWTASDDQFPDLQKLVLKWCTRLEEIPSCLENSLSLEMIEASRCNSSVASLVRQIQDVQMEMGNSVLKIHL